MTHIIDLSALPDTDSQFKVVKIRPMNIYISINPTNESLQRSHKQPEKIMTVFNFQNETFDMIRCIDELVMRGTINCL